jgi:hypothetical protein
MHRPEVVQRALVAHRRPTDVDPDELPVDAFLGDPSQRVLADEVRVLIQLDEPLQPADVERRVLAPHVRSVVEDAGLDPARLRWRDRADPVCPARLLDQAPQLISPRRVAEVELVADLSRPPGAGDHERDAVHLGFRAPVVPEVGDRVAEQVADHVLGSRSLDLHRRHIGFLDVDVEAGERGHALRVEQRVGIGEREPEPVLLETQQHRVVDDPAPPRGEQHVLALADRARGEVTARQEVRELERVRTRDLDASLHGDVPHRHVVQQRPVLGHGVVVQSGEQRVVVQPPALAPGTLGGLEVRGLPVPRLDVERERLGHRCSS